MRTNAQRAEDAYRALAVFCQVTGLDSGPNERQTAIKDLITNLLHLARRDCGVEDASHFAQLAADMHDIEVLEDEEE
jgi:hypothetical protein